MMQHLWFPFIFPCFLDRNFLVEIAFPTRKLTQAANANASAVLNVVAEVGSSVWGVGKMCVAFSFVDLLFDCLIQPFPKHEKTTQWNMHLRKISLCYLCSFFKLRLSSRLGNWCIKLSWRYILENHLWSNRRGQQGNTKLSEFFSQLREIRFDQRGRFSGFSEAQVMEVSMIQMSWQFEENLRFWVSLSFFFRGFWDIPHIFNSHFQAQETPIWLPAFRRELTQMMHYFQPLNQHVFAPDFLEQTIKGRYQVSVFIFFVHFCPVICQIAL